MPVGPMREPASPRLRSVYVLPPAFLVLAVLFWGLPSKDPLPRAMAQPPSLGSRAGELAQAPYPVPPNLVGLDLSKQTAEVAAMKSSGCVSCHRGQQEPHCKPAHEYGVPYHAMPFAAALRSHFRFLKRMGEPPTPLPVGGVAGLAG